MKNKTKKKSEELSDVLCEECGEPITKKRLKAIPHTTICINCAEELEETGAFVKSHIEVNPEVTGWEFEGVDQKIIKGN